MAILNSTFTLTSTNLSSNGDTLSISATDILNVSRPNIGVSQVSVANDADTLITKLMTMFYEDNINFNVRTFNTAIGSPLWNNDHFEKLVKNKEI